MSERTITQGPWFATKDSSHNDVCRIGRAWIIASPLALSNFGHPDADARLIAASPKLLDRLQAAVDALDALTTKVGRTGFQDSEEFYQALDAIDLGRATIAEATGSAA